MDENGENVLEVILKGTAKIVDPVTHLTQESGECLDVGILHPPLLLGSPFWNFTR